MSMGRGTFYNMASRFGFLLSSYAIHIGMAYLLTPEDYGALGVVISLVTLGRVFLSTGLPQATSRFIAEKEDDARGVLRASKRLQLVIAGIVLLLYCGGSPLWTRLLNDATLLPYILLSGLMIPLMGLHQIYLAYYNGLHRFGRQAFFVGVYSLGRVVFAFVLVAFGMRIGGVVLGFIIALVVATLWERADIGSTRTSAEYPLGNLVKLAIPLVLMSVGFSFLVNLDLLLLKHYYPDSPIIGYYNGAMNLGKTPYFIFFAFSMTVLPAVTRALSRGELERAHGLIRRNLSFLLLLGMPLAALVAATPGQTIDFIYPSAYREAAPALVILIGSMTLLAMLSSLTNILTAKGRPWLSMALVLACIPAQIGLGAWLIPRHGMIGAAASNGITVLVATVIGSIQVMVHFGALLEWGRVAKALAISVGLYFLARAFARADVSLLLLPLVYIGGFVLYSGLMFAAGGFRPSDVRAMLGRKSTVHANPNA